MSAQAARDYEAELTSILDRCNVAARDYSIPTKEELPEGYTGVFGHFPVYFPEEIVHAAKLLPVNILGGGNRLELKIADARMGSFICSICRSTTELGLDGTLGDMVGFMTHPICDAAKHLAGIWSRNVPNQLSGILYLPQNVNSPGAARYIASEYQRFRGELEKKIGHEISDEALRESLKIYNENRRMIRELYRIKREEPWKVSAPEAYLLVRARTRMPCEEHNVLLERALECIHKRNMPAQDKPRIVFVGGFCEQPPLEMIEAMDDNCYVVDDDLLIGLRWFTEDVPLTGDPIWALAESYIIRSEASPVQHDENKPKEGYLYDMVKKSNADGAILTAAKFCEPGLDEQIAWSKHFDELNIPYLVLEFEEKMTSFEQMAMQMETFAESLLFAVA
ncbi:MAG TPA: 2-hydroxyacyl-CoA dehydratase [Candidatus Desulfobacillus sp.]|nr:2-hydroxyacyl-CoA dehydratase [Candidatus Desulfobacillus sp.]